jgi:hypothetical protein
MGLRVSSFIQTAAVNRRRLHDSGDLSRRVTMSESNQFRQYAEEAMLWVAQSKTEEEKLVRTWTEAAVISERIIVGVGSLSEARAP